MKKPKKTILFISHCSHLGGAEIVLLRFLENVTEFTPILFSPSGPFSDGAIEKRIRTINSKYLRRLRKEENLFWPFRFFLQFLGSQFEIISLIKKIKPDIIQSNNFYVMIYCIVPCSILKLPLIWHMHDITKKKRVFNWLSWLFQFFSAKIIAVSDAVRSDLIESGIDPQKIKTVYNSISCEQVSVTDAKLARELQQLTKNKWLIVGSLATIEERKGIQEIIECIDMLVNKQKRNVHYVIAGEAKDLSQMRYLKELHQEIKEKKLQGNISFIGQIGAIQTFFEYIDVFVHFTKFSDPLATVILEALLFKCRVIVSDNGGNPECVQFGRWGKIVPEGKVIQLAEKIAKQDAPQFTPAEYKRFLEFFSHARKEREHMALYASILE